MIFCCQLVESEMKMLRSPGIVLIPWHVAACFHLRIDSVNSDILRCYPLPHLPEELLHLPPDRHIFSSLSRKRDKWCTFASASLTPCTGTQRMQRWHWPSSISVRSSLPGRWRGLVRKAIGGENGRAVDAAIPDAMHRSTMIMGLEIL